MSIFKCFRKSSNKVQNPASGSSPNPNSTSPQNFYSPFDYVTPAPADPPPVYTDTKTPHPTVVQMRDPGVTSVSRNFSNGLNRARTTNIKSLVSSIIPSASPTDDDNGNDPFAKLRGLDTVLLIDDSGSMGGSRWRETRDALKQLLPIVTKYDADGIDLYFFNHHSFDAGDLRAGKAGSGYRNISSPSAIEAIFREVQPSGRTPTGRRLRDILKPYVEHLAATKRMYGQEAMNDVPPLNLLCVTDGEASDAPENTIVEMAEALTVLGADLGSCGVQFFQVGDDPRVTAALKYLDDGLKEDLGCRDMVDTITWERDERGERVLLSGEAMLKCVLGAVNRRYDAQRQHRK